MQDVAALGSEHSSSSTGTAGEAEAATFAGMSGMDVAALIEVSGAHIRIRIS